MSVNGELGTVNRMLTESSEECGCGIDKFAMLEVDCKTEMCQEICPNNGRFNVGLHKDPLETSPKTDVKCERPLAITVDGGAIGSLQRKLRRLEIVTPWRRDDTDFGTSIDKETEATRLVTDIKEATGS
ncbi:hypothetical protein SprV_0301122800 [Sparganum proliferum]